MRPCTTQIIGHSALIGSVRRQCLIPQHNGLLRLCGNMMVRRWKSTKPDPWAALENNRIVSTSPTSKRSRRNSATPRQFAEIESTVSSPPTSETSKPTSWAALESNRTITSSPTSSHGKKADSKVRGPVKKDWAGPPLIAPTTSTSSIWAAPLDNKTVDNRIISSSSMSKLRKSKNGNSKRLHKHRSLLRKPRRGLLIETSRAPASRLVARSRRQIAMDHDPSRAENPVSEFEVDSKERTIATIIGNLPVSPIMDPGFWDAKEKYKRSKPLKSDEPMTSVIRQFRKNPFAHALATPLRQCSMSRARLPKFFLQNFNVLLHPQTGRPWWVPNLNPPDLPEERVRETSGAPTESDFDPSLLSNPERSELSDPFSFGSTSPVDILDSQLSSQAAEAQQALADKQHAEQVLLRKDRTMPSGPKTNALARRDLFRAFTQSKSGFEGAENRILGTYSGKTRNMAVGAVWRVDMDTVVLDLMRQDIMADLIYIANLTLRHHREKRHHIQKVPHGWDGINEMRRGAILWFGGPASPAELWRDREREKKEKGEAEREELRKKEEENFRAARDVTRFLDPGALAETAGLVVKGVPEAAETKQPVQKALAQDRSSGRSAKYVPGPGPCAVLTLKSPTPRGEEKEEGILVHNIPHLLGAEHTARLQRDVKMFRKRGNLFVCSGKKCTGLQVKLWKLQGYLTDYKTPLGWTWSHDRSEPE